MAKLKAFTLVELMVVMAIIAFLSVGAYAGLTFALRQGRDTQRMRIADQIQTALTAYYADYAKYPGCGWNGTTFGAGSTFSGAPAGYVFCPNALDSTGSAFPLTSAPGGLKDYFEGEYTTGPMAKTNSSDKDIRYYYVKSGDGSGTKFTVCVALENKNGGNESTATVNLARSSSARPGCYCNGSDQSTIACSGIQ